MRQAELLPRALFDATYVTRPAFREDGPLMPLLRAAGARIEPLRVSAALFDDGARWERILGVVEAVVGPEMPRTDPMRTDGAAWRAALDALSPSDREALAPAVEQLSAFDVVSVANTLRARESVVLFLAAAAGVPVRVAVLCNVAARTGRHASRRPSRRRRPSRSTPRRSSSG